MAPQLQINQGPQDALLFDNTRSYFTNVGYVRTSNFQMELRDVDPQNTANLGATVNFVIPKAADLLGPCDLMIKFNQVEEAPAPGCIWGWVESVGYAMIEKITFSVGSHDIETLTGDHLNIMNELMRSDSHRYGFHHVLKTGRPLAKGQDSGMSGHMYWVDEDLDSGSYDRVIATRTATRSIIKQGKELIIPLGLFFCAHPSKYFPLAAIAGSNDVRISVKFRTIPELLQAKGEPVVGTNGLDVGSPSSDSGASSIKFKNGSAFQSGGCFLRCHYIHVTGPEATALMNREHVRLMKLWHGNEVSKQFEVKCTAAGSLQTLDVDLSFLHPVQELIITIRKVSDMGSSVKTDIAPGDDAKPVANTAHDKSYFTYHGAGRGDPNMDTLFNTFEGEKGDLVAGTTLKTKTFTLKINGQTRHLDGQGVDRNYLMNRLMPMLHSNTSTLYEQIYDGSQVQGLAYDQNNDTTSRPQYGGDWNALKELVDRKEIYVYPFALNPEGANPSGSVNFSKVSHAKLSIAVEGILGQTTSGPLGSDQSENDTFQVDVYGIYYNWLAIKDGRALTSFA